MARLSTNDQGEIVDSLTGQVGLTLHEAELIVLEEEAISRLAQGKPASASIAAGSKYTHPLADTDFDLTDGAAPNAIAGAADSRGVDIHT